MIKLIVTASDELYSTLSNKVRAAGDIPQRAHNVLQGFKQAEQLGSALTGEEPVDRPPRGQLTGIVVDMSLHAADTLIETLHSRPSTSGIPLVAIKCDGQTVPLALRRLCIDILEMDSSAPLEEQTMDKL